MFWNKVSKRFGFDPSSVKGDELVTTAAELVSVWDCKRKFKVTFPQRIGIIN